MATYYGQTDYYGGTGSTRPVRRTVDDPYTQLNPTQYSQQPIKQPIGDVRTGDQVSPPTQPRPFIQQPVNPGIPPNPFVGPNIHPTVPPEFQPGAPDPRQQNISDALLQQLMSFIGNPSRYNQDIVDSRFAHQREVLGRGYDAQAGKINEDLARRGLFYSTEVGGRMGDLRGQQAQAEAGLLSDLTMDQTRTYGEDMQRAINTILGFGSQQFGQQQATAQLNMLQDQQMRDFLLQLLGGTS